MGCAPKYVKAMKHVLSVVVFFLWYSSTGYSAIPVDARVGFYHVSDTTIQLDDPRVKWNPLKDAKVNMGFTKDDRVS